MFGLFGFGLSELMDAPWQAEHQPPTLISGHASYRPHAPMADTAYRFIIRTGAILLMEHDETRLFVPESIILRVVCVSVCLHV